jgi:formylglycine-generating enzyme required for sulfatase activity
MRVFLSGAFPGWRYADTWVHVSRGNFVSGGSRSADERPLVVKHLKHDTCVMRRPVTNAEFATFHAAHPRPYGVEFLAHWRLGRCPDALRDHPVLNLRPEDADAYAAWAGARLPTADEWEKAVRGWDGRNFPWGDVFDPARANTAEAGRDGTCPADAHPQGPLFGAVGDAFEYTASFYRDRPDRGRVAMGGSYAHPALRASLRLSHTLSGRLRCGLRLAKDDHA